MAHTFDTSQANSGLSANPSTFTYTCGAGSTVLVLSLVVAGNTARTGGAPTYNGLTLTQGDSLRTATESNITIWYLFDPPTSSAFTMSIPNTNGVTIHAVTCTAKAQAGFTSALDVANGATGTGANPSTAVVTTVNGDFVVDRIGHGVGAVTGVTGNQTLLFATDHGQFCSFSQYALQASLGSISFTWTVGADDWCHTVLSFKEVSLGWGQILSDKRNRLIL